MSGVGTKDLLRVLAGPVRITDQCSLCSRPFEKVQECGHDSLQCQQLHMPFLVAVGEISHDVLLNSRWQYSKPIISELSSVSNVEGTHEPLFRLWSAREDPCCVLVHWRGKRLLNDANCWLLPTTRPHIPPLPSR